MSCVVFFYIYRGDEGKKAADTAVTFKYLCYLFAIFLSRE